MKTLVSVFVAGALSMTGAFAEAGAGTSPNVAGNDNTIATPRVPFQPLQKRPTGAQQAAVAAPRANVATPQLPFRPYQKRPTAAPSSKPNGIEANR